MKITIIGTGYVGLVSGACFAEMGNDVICVDNNKQKIENLKQAIIPIYEPNLEEMVLRNYKNNRLNFTIDLKQSLINSNICFIAVGTPMEEDGSADLKYVLEVASLIGKYITHHIYVINKSTVPVGTAKKVRDLIQEELSKRGSNITFDVISNPEFLKEGSAIEDFMKPDRIVIGVDNDKAMEVMRELYAPFSRNHDRFISMDIKSAEMTKYASNAMLATKISFINEIANICERVGADVNKVRIGIGSDSRIGFSFIYAGCGYGGSCFPKDVQALIKTSKDFGYNPKILNAIEAVNNEQKMVLVNKIIDYFGNDLSDKVFAIWGLSFKPETDDMREASSIVIINELTKRGAIIKAYDPKAIKEAKDFYLKDNKNIEYFDNKYDTLNNSDAMILVTEWKEFRSPNWLEMEKRLKNKIIFDGRNQYNKDKLNASGFKYFQIGV
jgi:UDPglucose 6-dehydrogenase